MITFLLIGCLANVLLIAMLRYYYHVQKQDLDFPTKSMIAACIPYGFVLGVASALLLDLIQIARGKQ